ncbi:PHP domain-containing protein [bacterium]|nr:MAG: PHP domain-containing protein [bacterium]
MTGGGAAAGDGGPPPRIDLHAHTTASDGSLAPRELVALAAAHGVTHLAVTDHDTTAGLAEAAAAAQDLGITLVPGIELSTEADGISTDILGYFVDPAAPALQAVLARIRTVRQTRVVTMVERLRELGAPITLDDVYAFAGADTAIARPHVARALVAAGFVDDVPDAFRRYIGRHGPAYAERYKLTAPEACRLVRAAGGVPVVAHPTPPNDPLSDPKRLRTYLPPLVEAGLGGLECYYPGYPRKVNRWLEALAWHFRLVPTGGTDYHGAWRASPPPGGVDVPPDTVARLWAARR